MQLRVRGTVELVGDDGSAGSAALSANARRLLAGLLVHANSVVSVDRLADIV
ncbi:hypothetical protein BH20ACT6_BH20ACT6_09230 [soil metagenome]